MLIALALLQHIQKKQTANHDVLPASLQARVHSPPLKSLSCCEIGSCVLDS